MQLGRRRHGISLALRYSHCMISAIALQCFAGYSK